MESMTTLSRLPNGAVLLREWQEDGVPWREAWCPASNHSLCPAGIYRQRAVGQRSPLLGRVQPPAYYFDGTVWPWRLHREVARTK